MTLPPDVHARPPAAGDGDALLALIAACDESYFEWARPGWSAPEISPDWAKRFAEPERWSQCACDGGGAIVAFVSFKPARARDTPGFDAGPPVPGVARVAAVFVHPARWREGIAAAMLELAEARMRSRGFAAAQLWTPEGAPAERFYAAQGWRRDGRFGWHPWIGLTVIGYAKSLGRAP